MTGDEKEKKKRKSKEKDDQSGKGEEWLEWLILMKERGSLLIWGLINDDKCTIIVLILNASMDVRKEERTKLSQCNR